MTKSTARTGVFALMFILGISTMTMVWLYWHYPLGTSLATLAVLAVLGVSARLARSVEGETSELESGSEPTSL